MPRKTLKQYGRNTMFVALLGVGSLGMTGCQVDVGGQTLPSAYYLTDDVQYFNPGPEFKLAREGAALKANRAQRLREER